MSGFDIDGSDRISSLGDWAGLTLRDVEFNKGDRPPPLLLAEEEGSTPKYPNPGDRSGALLE